jgi:predicted enzyme related to lactoylglutathione lyase
MVWYFSFFNTVFSWKYFEYSTSSKPCFSMQYAIKGFIGLVTQSKANKYEVLFYLSQAASELTMKKTHEMGCIKNSRAPIDAISR